MADERYGWLDPQAAERLLRGEPVVADDDYVRLQAERLAEALEDVRAARTPPPGPAGELPGEEQALTAFRAARAAAGARAQGAAPGPPAGDLGSVHIGGTATHPLRRPPAPAGGCGPPAGASPPRWPAWRWAASPSPRARACCPPLGGDPEPAPRRLGLRHARPPDHR